MVASDKIAQNTGNDRAGALVNFGEILLRPQGSCCRVGFLRTGNPPFDMSIRIATLPDIALETIPELAEVMPQPGQRRPVCSTEFGGERCRKP